MKSAIFLDRDGVLNNAIVVEQKPFSPKNISEVTFAPDVVVALSKLRELGFVFVVVTNQPDISRGIRTHESVDEINQYIGNKLQIKHFFVCPHSDEDSCECRKPKPGLILEAASKLDIDVSRSYLVGDRWRDIEAGQKAGCLKSFWINHLYSERAPIGNFIEVKSLLGAANLICRISQ